MSDDLQDVRISVAKIEAQSAEANRRLDKIERVLESITATATAIATMSSKIDNHERRLKGIEDALMWVGRIVIGAVVLAILGLVIVKTGVGPV